MFGLNIEKNKVIKIIMIAILIIIVACVFYKLSVNNNNKETYGPMKQILYFSSKHCPHCKKFQTTWDKFYDTYKHNTFIKLKEIDGATNRDIVKQYNIKGYPSIIAVDENGKKFYNFAAPRTMKNLIAFMTKVSSEP